MHPRKQSDALSTMFVNVNSKSIVHISFYKSLIFQILITFYYCFLTLFGMNTNNTRIIVYCLLFILNQFTKIINSLLNSIDPLQISSTRMFFNLIGWACKVNLLYQIFVLFFLQHPLPIVLMAIHFLVANYRLHRPDLSHFQRKGRSFYKIMDFINPILLYSFLKQFDTEQSDLSIIFLIFLCMNLICASQLRMILAHQESNIVGWSEVILPTGKSDMIWNRMYAFKLILILTCGLLFLENISLFIESIRNEVSLNILHTLIIGFTCFFTNPRQPNTFQ